MSYQTYTTPALSLSQKGSPDRISRVKNPAQQYAILYRPAALRRPHYPHGGAQSSKPRRGNAQSLRGADPRQSASNKRSVQGSRGRGLKGPPIYRGLGTVQGS